MDKIKWCIKQKKGITLNDPNLNLSRSYMERAQSDLKNLQNQNSVWRIIIAYYSCYNSLYSVLIRYGIKSEIHDCSIELMRLFDGLLKFKNFLNELKENRINVQYYLKEPTFVDFKKVERFIYQCRLELDEVNENKIRTLWEKLQ